MKIGFGLRRGTVLCEYGGGGRFSALFMRWLQKQGHQVHFIHPRVKPDIDVIYDVAINTSVQQIQKYQKKGVPTIYRMDGMGCKVKDRPQYIAKCLNANHVIFQSRFAKRCVKHFTKEVKNHSIIYNGVPLQSGVSIESRNDIKVLAYLRPQDTWNRKLGGLEWLEVLNRHQKEFGYEIVRIDGSRKLERSDFLTLMKECDVFIHTSYYEICSNALLEAMSCGCAVIATNDSGNAELIGPEGCLVQTQPAIRSVDYNQFVDKDCDFLPVIEMNQDDAYKQLKNCLENLQHFKQYSLDRVQEHFTIEKQAQAYFDLMKRVVDE